MLQNKTHIFPEPEATAEAVAKLIVEKIKQKKGQAEPFNLAISGGSTPNLLFAMLANDFADEIDWKKLRVFWVDERCVAPDDTESNFGNTNKIWLKKVPIPQENIIRMQGENEPTAEAQRYAKLLAEKLPQKNALPVFDLVLLGMGDDGHTASIFPDNMQLIHSPEFVATAKHPQSGQNRITLTGEVICNAKQVLFIITGHSKAEVLEQIMHEKGDFERFPAYYILSTCDAELYVDDEAVERL